MTAIPQSVLDAGWKWGVHVEGWRAGTWFLYVKTVDGEHTLRAPRSGLIYVTRNRLLYTKRHS